MIHPPFSEVQLVGLMMAEAIAEFGARHMDPGIRLGTGSAGNWYGT
jgi:hypothetical protein